MLFFLCTDVHHRIHNVWALCHYAALVVAALSSITAQRLAVNLFRFGCIDFYFFDVETLVFRTLKWIKNGPKFNQKSSKNRVPHWPGSWDDFSGVLGASWRRLWSVLEGSWSGLGGLLASLGGALGASWAVLERRRGILEASWNVLRTSEAVFEAILFAKNHLFWAMLSWMQFFNRFWLVFVLEI